jgi:hypothetical protein
MINLKGEVTLFRYKYSEYLNTCIIKGMVEIYDIVNITSQNLYHMPYQPETHITPRVAGPRGDIGFSGWYGMWCIFQHVIFSIYHIFRLKYRCFVYALSMIVPSLYHLPYVAPLDLYRIPYIVWVSSSMPAIYWLLFRSTSLS